MKSGWSDEDITKALKKAGKSKVDEAVFERVWVKLEDKLTGRERRYWERFVWRPWGHPVRWVLAACFCVVLTGVVRHQDSVDRAEIASYLISISDPAAEEPADQEIVRVSALLSEPSSMAGRDILSTEDDSEELGSGDGGLLL
jgi:hypothetical protein